MSRRRPPTLRVTGYDQLATDHQLARKIYMRFGCYRADELSEGFCCWECLPCAHSESCRQAVGRIREIITADRILERNQTGEILVKLTGMIRKLKKDQSQ